MTTSSLKAIETVYRGYRFRSRLEARWAVFFDALGVRWEYEKEGYDLGPAGWYLPDFWLPDQDCWVEIKGEHTCESGQKCAALAEVSGHNVYEFFGDCWCPWEQDHDGAYVNYGDLGWDNFQWWCECPNCHVVGIRFDGKSERLCKCFPGDHGDGWNTPRLRTAYLAARQARFEHRESPQR